MEYQPTKEELTRWGARADQILESLRGAGLVGIDLRFITVNESEGDTVRFSISYLTPTGVECEIEGLGIDGHLGGDRFHEWFKHNVRDPYRVRSMR